MGDHAAPTRTDEPTFLTPTEASRATGISVFSLAQYRQLRKRGVLRGPDFVRHGRAILYPSASVHAFLASRAES